MDKKQQEWDEYFMSIYGEGGSKAVKKEDIKNVTGIGNSKYASIEEFIVVK